MVVVFLCKEEHVIRYTSLTGVQTCALPISLTKLSLGRDDSFVSAHGRRGMPTRSCHRAGSASDARPVSPLRRHRARGSTRSEECAGRESSKVGCVRCIVKSKIICDAL